MPPQQTSLNQALTVAFRKFAGMNQTDARTAMADEQSGGQITEWYWLDNVIPVGAGNLRLVPPQGPVIASIGAGIATLWGFQMSLSGVETSLLFSVNQDGSVSQINPETGVIKSVAGAGVLSRAARLAMWKDSPLLLIDPVKGYFSWDGTALVVLDATKVARDIAVFEQRVWIQQGNRAITFTAPASYTDFTAANGGGSVTITDSAFSGQIVRLLSALQQLWIVGPGAINAISNVETGGSPLVTTFSQTNIVTNIGTKFTASVNSFFRTFIFISPSGVYAIVGSTPQKLSDKLDNLTDRLTYPNGDAPSAVVSLYDVFLWVVLVTAYDPVQSLNRPVLLCFSQGKWFVASQGNLTWITGLVDQNGNSTAWGTDGSSIFRLFAGTGTVKYRMVTKLFDFGSATMTKELLRVGIEVTVPTGAANILAQVENERQVAPLSLVPTSVVGLTFYGQGVITFIGAGGLPINWYSGGLLQLLRVSTTGSIGHGRYFGLGLSGTSVPYTMSALAFEVKPAGDWVE